MDFVAVAVACLCALLAFLLGRATRADHRIQIAALQAQLTAAHEKLQMQTDLEGTLAKRFESVAAHAIASHNDLFLHTATAHLTPLLQGARQDFTSGKEAVRDIVAPLATELKRVEAARAESQGILKQQMMDLAQHSHSLVIETRNLATALKRPEGRGAWGEMQLRRVVELAGMVHHCDFTEQVSATAADGKRDRPDMVIHLPNGREIVVDAKAPIQAYLTAMEADTDTERQDALEKVARQVSARAQELARKSYWESFDTAPDFVVMFLPGEFLLPVALEHEPDLLDQSMAQNVVIATPNTLVALLKAVAMGWREMQLTERAEEIGRLGQEVHDKLYTYVRHVERTGMALRSAVTHFNHSIGTLDGRNSVLDRVRRFKDLGVPSSKEIPALTDLADTSVRTLDLQTEDP